MDAIKEIKHLIMARYPIIYILSSEEERVSRIIGDIAEKSGGYDVSVWSYSFGLRNLENIDSCTDNKNGELDILRAIYERNKKEIFILNGFHAYLTEQYYDVIRYLKELARVLKTTKKTIIIISPILRIPLDLEKDVAVVDFPLPNEKEIKNIYSETVSTLKRNPKINLKTNGNGENLLKALLGLTENEVRNVLYKSIVKHGEFNIETIIGEKEQIIKKSGILKYYHTQEGLDDIGGLDALKEWIIKRKYAFKNKAREFGLPYPKGLLLLGVQGCGKSLSSKVTSKLWGFPLLRLDFGNVMAGIVGQSEQNINNAIKIAESIAPCILWIDELEKGVSGVQSSNFSDAGTTARVFGTFLTWLQEKTKPVFVVATANDISQLPPELMRKGRFDEIFFVDLPTLNERIEIFNIHLSKRNRNPDDFDIGILAKKSEEFSGAEIEAAIESGLYDAFDANRKLTTDDILKAIKDTVPLSTTMNDRITDLRKWAETRARNASVIKGKGERARLIEVD